MKSTTTTTCPHCTGVLHSPGAYVLNISLGAAGMFVAMGGLFAGSFLLVAIGLLMLLFALATRRA